MIELVPTRRAILRAAASLAVLPTRLFAARRPLGRFDFAEDWEGLNPGYWRQDGRGIRRVLRMVGDRARALDFPFHPEFETDARRQDRSLPLGTIWHRRWQLKGEYRVTLSGVVRALTPASAVPEEARWRMYRPDYGMIAIAFGGATQFESFYPAADATPMLVLREDGCIAIARHSDWEIPPVAPDAMVDTGRPLEPGDRFELALSVAGRAATAIVSVNGAQAGRLSWTSPGPLSGLTGIAARGLLDVSVSSFEASGTGAVQVPAPLNTCHVAYALGDTLREKDGTWSVRFVALFRHQGTAEIRIADREQPPGGWARIPVAGRAPVVSNEFRCRTAIIDATLPASPADTDLFFTVWLDGVDVTADPRPGTASVGPGTGLVGDVPVSGRYVGRLPRLTPPYRLAGLSCHAIHTASASTLPDASKGRCTTSGSGSGVTCPITAPYFVHDQPCTDAFQHFEAFGLQVLLWEDDVWYLELLLYPPSTEDAYKIITTTIAGPTTRWQMMRHWNVLNPGDHDYGMDDVKGPEQLLVRTRDDLGQDADYMRRNFQIVAHLMSGDPAPSGTTNPKRWRKWTMPGGDFAIIVLDARLWRSSQETALWSDSGWPDKALYSRRDPTRSLLGEEQFAWLEKTVRTTPAPLICVTGLNALHSIWGGHDGRRLTRDLRERERVSADYAGWVKAGADRVLDLLASRPGIVTVYGDVHAGSIIRNKHLNLYECSFGPIGRWGGREVVEGFGPDMLDFDGRAVEAVALYHDRYDDARLSPQSEVNYWNFLEARFDPCLADPVVKLTLRNITDAPTAAPRGGGAANFAASTTGKTPIAWIPGFRTFPYADVQVLDSEGQPVVATKARRDGLIPPVALNGIRPGTDMTVVARRGVDVRADVRRATARR